MIKRIAIISTHPIQYNAPWFKLLAAEETLELKVFYTWSQAEAGVKDKTFGKTITWDIPLLDGYDYCFVKNISKDPGPHHKQGIDCPSLISNISAWNPDVVLVFGWYLKSHFKVMKYFKGKIPVWFRGDSTLLNESLGIKKILRRLYLTWVYKYIDKALYVGSENKKYFKVLGVKENQLVFAPHAIDNERFFDSNERDYEAHAELWRQELGYTKDDIVVLFAGKFESIKQPDVLLKAFQRVNRQRQKPLKLVMAGNGPMEDSLMEMAENDHNITFLPFQNQSKMPILYRLGNVMCLPSKGETWGLAVNEAMACKRPVIVSNKVGCSGDLVKHNRNGFVFHFDNINSLITILDSLDVSSLNEYGDNAKNDISHWNFGEIVLAVQENINKL